MRLQTLGNLSVEGASYQREKPLLLLAYLCLEGHKTRKQLAELFWPNAANPMNSLAQHLIRLRPLGGVVCEDGPNVSPTCECDALDFRAHLRAGRLSEALALYQGAFLGAAGIKDNYDLQQWVDETRDTLGAEARSAALTLAELHRSRRETAEALHYAELAYTLPGAPPCDPEDLLRLHHLLGRGHPLAAKLKLEAQELELPLPSIPAAPPAPLLLGRQAELTALSELPAGQIAWISGPAGIGKSTLLAALASGGGWRILPGRSGLPLATLEPLAAHPLSNTAEAFNLLRDPHLKIAIDGWEDADDTTQTVLNLAARQRPGATIIISARQAATLNADQQYMLGPLSAEDLHTHPGALEATAGHPSLLMAYLRGSPPERTLEAHLNFLGENHKRLFLALAAQDPPHLNATRSALNLSATTYAQILDHLTREGLTTSAGLVRPTAPARDLLASRPLDTQLLHLQLARCHPHTSAWPHFLSAIHLWEESDQEAAAKAAHYYADQELKRGYPARAAKTLEVAPQTDEVKLARGWALLGKGLLTEAMEVLTDLTELNEVRAAKAYIYMRQGKHNMAKKCLLDIPKDGGISHAYAETVRAHLERRNENWQAAINGYNIADNLWLLNGRQRESIECKCFIAKIEIINGRAPREAFHELLERDGDDFYSSGMILINFAESISQISQLAAIEYYKKALDKFIATGDYTAIATAQNNIATSEHIMGNYAEAREVYTIAMKNCESSGDMRLFSLISCNLSELEDDISKFNATISLLNESNHEKLGAAIQANLKHQEDKL